MDNLILANLRHRPTRSLVTTCGVALGTVLILMTVGLARGLLNEQAQRAAKVGAEIIIRASGTFNGGLASNQPSLPAAHTEELRRISGIRTVTPMITYLQTTDTGLGFRSIEGVDFQSYSEISGLQLLRGRLPQGENEVVIDEEKEREELKKSKGRPVTELDVMGRAMKVVGVYGPESGARIKMPLAEMQTLLAAPGLCSMILVKCASPADQEGIAAQILAQFPDDQVILTRDLPTLYSNSDALNVFLRVVVGISIIISTLVIALAMYTSITERTREIGILKSLGATNVFIVRSVEQEALLISLSGAVLGFLVCLAARAAIVSTTTFRRIDFEPRWVLTALGVAVLGGAVGALYPAIRAARLDPVKALDYE